MPSRIDLLWSPPTCCGDDTEQWAVLGRASLEPCVLDKSRMCQVVDLKLVRIGQRLSLLSVHWDRIRRTSTGRL
jgi:hypothetical protein